MSSEPFDRADQATPAGLGDRLDDLLLRAEAWVASSRTVFGAGIVVAVAVAVTWFALSRTGPQVPIENTIPLADAASTVPPPSSMPPASIAEVGDDADGQAQPDDAETGAAAEDVVVHVVGSVRRPGLVTLVAGDRISDAVDAAGGASADADLDRLNLASPVVDGMQIRVPSAAEDPEEAGVERPLIQLPAAGGASSGGVTSSSDEASSTAPVDVNRADEGELQRLPGIGPALAARIVAWRAENGGFVSVDDLESVPGIGPAKLAGLRDLVVV